MQDGDLAKALQSLAVSDSPLPPADIVWRRAEVRKRLREYERAMRPVIAVQWAGAAACLAVGGICLTPMIDSALSSMPPPLATFSLMGAALMIAVATWLVRALVTER